MLEKPEAVFYFGDKPKVFTVPEELSLKDRWALLPLGEFLRKSTWFYLCLFLLIRLIHATADSLTLYFIFMIIIGAWFPLGMIWIEFRPPRRNDRRGRVFLYRNRVVTHGIWGLNIYDALMNTSVFPNVIALVFLVRSDYSPASVVFTSTMIVASFLIAYRLWGGGVVIDLRTGEVYKDYLLLTIPLCHLDDFDGIDAVTCHPNMEDFFFRARRKEDFYGKGLPVSGMIGNNDDDFRKEFEERVLDKIGVPYPPKASEPSAQTRSALGAKMRLKDGTIANSADFNPIYVYTDFHYYSGKGFSQGAFICGYSVGFISSRSEYVELAKFKIWQKGALNTYLAGFRRTFGEGIEIKFMDNRFNANGV